MPLLDSQFLYRLLKSYYVFELKVASFLQYFSSIIKSFVYYLYTGDIYTCKGNGKSVNYCFKYKSQINSK